MGKGDRGRLTYITTQMKEREREKRRVSDTHSLNDRLGGKDLGNKLKQGSTVQV